MFYRNIVIVFIVLILASCSAKVRVDPDFTSANNYKLAVLPIKNTAKIIHENGTNVKNIFCQLFRVNIT